MKVLVAVDLQNDFINGALGTAEAAAMLPRAERKIRSFEGLVLFTRDTHTEDYLNTREGKALPVPHWHPRQPRLAAGRPAVALRQRGH